MAVINRYGRKQAGTSFGSIKKVTMKKIVVGIILLVGVMGFVDPNIFYEDKMASFKWLIGSWAMNSKNELIVETWIPMSDSIIEGESMKFNKKTSETVPLEKMRLICRNKEFFYIPMKEGQQNNQPVEFKIISFSKKGFTAVNQAHNEFSQTDYL
jgi:hypothetical protein